MYSSINSLNSSNFHFISKVQTLSPPAGSSKSLQFDVLIECEVVKWVGTAPLCDLFDVYPSLDGTANDGFMMKPLLFFSCLLTNIKSTYRLLAIMVSSMSATKSFTLEVSAWLGLKHQWINCGWRQVSSVDPTCSFSLNCLTVTV